jgi:hypothetical protein
LSAVQGAGKETIWKMDYSLIEVGGDPVMAIFGDGAIVSILLFGAFSVEV